ncbi:MAG: hypothetical protein DMG57_05410 [Acidobacteria bacterium]|nr:MAG: hypothetical protein DMG57_05410 [Acidobacteriota bacterium]
MSKNSTVLDPETQACVADFTFRRAPLFYVSPGQINALVPPSIVPGVAVVQVRRGNRPALRRLLSAEDDRTPGGQYVAVLTKINQRWCGLTSFHGATLTRTGAEKGPSIDGPILTGTA